MAGTGNFKLESLRPSRFESERILLALAIAVLVHVLLYGGYELGHGVHWLRLPWLAPPRQPQVRVQPVVEPIEFVMVNTPSTEAPEEAKLISNKNSVAADNSQNQNQNNPQVNGKQTDVKQTVTEFRFQPSKSPTGDNVGKQAATQEQPQPKPSVSAGDLTLGKPEAAQQEQERPRTVREALAQMANHIPSMTMNEEGGVQRHAQVPSLNVKITGFGDYDERFVEAVTQNWYNLLYSQKFALDRTGKVVLQFRLNADGSISDMKVGENNVGPLLSYVCEKAVLDGAPYERWTEDMRLKLGNYADVQFTFDYFSDL